MSEYEKCPLCDGTNFSVLTNDHYNTRTFKIQCKKCKAIMGTLNPNAGVKRLWKK